MAKSKTTSTDLSNVLSEESLAMLQESYPLEQSSSRIMLPRIKMVSQDATEEVKNPKTGRKEIKIITEAGTFFLEKETNEVDEETGKKVWDSKELGNSIEGVILFQRKQLKMYDETTEEYTSSNVYDNDDEEVILWCNKSEVGRGTPKELKAEYQYTDKRDNKVKSKLEENRILYILHEGEVYQMNLRGSSMYSFLTYARKTLPPSVITVFSSEPKEKGSINWNQMTFTPKRKLTQSEALDVIEKVKEIKAIVSLEKSQFQVVKKDDELKKFVEEANGDAGTKN